MTTCKLQITVNGDDKTMINLRQMIGQGVSFFRFPNLPDVLSGPFMRYIPGNVYTFADNVYSRYLINKSSIF